MNVHLIPVTMEPLAWTNLKATAASVPWATRASIAKNNSPIAETTLAQNKPCARPSLVSEIIPAFAKTGTPEPTAMSPLIPALLMETLAKIMPNAFPYNRAGSNANANLDGRVPCARPTSTTVPNFPVSLMPIVPIWSMILAALVPEGLLAKDARSKWIFADLHRVCMDFVSIGCLNMNAFAILVGRELLVISIVSKF